MEVGRTERALHDHPPGRKNDKIGECRALVVALGRQDSVYARIGVVVGYGIHGVEMVEGVFVGGVGAVPRYYVEGGMGRLALEQNVLEFVVYFVRYGRRCGGAFVVAGGGVEKVACVGEAVGTDGAQLCRINKLKMVVVSSFAIPTKHAPRVVN